METIYTIPVNEAFEEGMKENTCICPFCKLHNDTENNELELILGASMMEPDVRIKTNDLFFCDRHFKSMLTRKNRLGLCLIIESHLAEIKKSGLDEKKLRRLEDSCYICGRIEYTFSRMIENSIVLWSKDREFRKKTSEQSMFCLPHYRRFLEAGKRGLSRKDFQTFEEDIHEVAMRYFDSLAEDVSWFCKKFDYRYEDESWGTSKDSAERALKMLKGDIK